MTTLREILRESDPKLHEILQRNWKIAWESWLPALGIKRGSYNSYPHLRNLEQYLDDLVLKKNAVGEVSIRIQLSPAEIYILLASVLFHDIGNIKTYKEHAEKSQNIINDHYGVLGIPSVVLAQCIGRICEYHDPKDPAKSRQGLMDIIIGSYGLIREVVIASLLTFADALDSAYTRVIPEYLLSSGDIEIVGLFRRFITGVFVDHEVKMVRVSLSAFEPNAPGQLSKNVKYRPIKENSNSEIISEWKERHLQKNFNFKNGINLLTQYLSKTKKAKHFGKRDQWYVARQLSKIMSDSDNSIIRIQQFLQGIKNRNLTKGQIYIARQLLKIINDVEDGKKEKSNGSWSPYDIAAVIMGDVKHNRVALDRIRNDLAAIGIPIHAWLIECHEHLFNEWGEETFEPVFSKDFLERVAEQMWAISTSVFGTTLFTYENLSAAVREPDIDKIKRAVRRIALVTQDRADHAEDGPLQNVIWVGNTQWKWYVKQASHNDSNWRCRCIALEAVKYKIKKELASPND